MNNPVGNNVGLVADAIPPRGTMRRLVQRLALLCLITDGLARKAFQSPPCTGGSALHVFYYEPSLTQANVQWIRGGLVFEAHRLFFYSA